MQIALLIQKLLWNSCSVLFMVWCLWCVSTMFFSSFLVFVITLVAGMIVSSNCSLFLVFHTWVSIVVVSVRVNFCFWW